MLNMEILLHLVVISWYLVGSTERNDDLVPTPPLLILIIYVLTMPFDCRVAGACDALHFGARPTACQGLASAGRAVLVIGSDASHAVDLGTSQIRNLVIQGSPINGEGVVLADHQAVRISGPTGKNEEKQILMCSIPQLNATAEIHNLLLQISKSIRE